MFMLCVCEYIYCIYIPYNPNLIYVHILYLCVSASALSVMLLPTGLTEPELSEDQQRAESSSQVEF